MKRELEKKIRAICDEIGTSAAQEACGDITEELKSEYEKLVDGGMSELDAYRDVLRGIDEIKKALDALPKSEEEQLAADRKDGLKDLKNILSKISSVMWLSIVIFFFLISFTTGAWHITWLIFLWGSICQNVLDMVLKYNKGKPLRKVLRSGLNNIMWLVIVIAYFLISFATGMWHITWLIFILGALVSVIIK
ncbi:MAG: urea transporter [Ruminococcaceae bacterium]|nr:urea transporter [Oscillospiraceae bacterium]